MKTNLTIAVDFDGVIHDFKNPVPGRKMGPPINGTQEALEIFKRYGCKIIVFTVWGSDAGRPTIEKFMEYYKLPYDTITNIKPQADFYIDDKALRFTSWENAIEQLNGTTEN